MKLTIQILTWCLVIFSAFATLGLLMEPGGEGFMAGLVYAVAVLINGIFVLVYIHDN